MSFINDVGILNGAVAPVLYFSSDLPTNSVPVTDNASFNQSQILTNDIPSASTFQAINTISCLDDFIQRNNDTSFIDSFNFLDDKDPVVINSNLSLDVALPQQPVLYSYVPQISLPIQTDADITNPLDFVINNVPSVEPIISLPMHTDADVTNPLDFVINNVPSVEPISVQNLVNNNVWLTNDTLEPILVTTNNDQLPMSPLSLSLDNTILEGTSIETIMECDQPPPEHTELHISPDGVKTENKIEIETASKKENILTRWAGRPRRDGTSLYCFKKWKKCCYCDKKYLSYNVMRKHVQKFHLDVHRRNTCKECRHVFDSHEKLIVHAADHWKPREKCPIGGTDSCIKYSNKRSLKFHLSECHIDTVNTIRPHGCNQCTLTFNKPSLLKRHIRTHTGEKPFKCPESECERSFAQKNTLVNHLLTHTKQKPHKCPRCLSSFSQAYNLFLHLFRVHYEHRDVEGTVQCEKCPNKYEFKGQLEIFKHYMKSHKELAMSYLTNNINMNANPISKKRKHLNILGAEDSLENNEKIYNKSSRSRKNMGLNSIDPNSANAEKTCDIDIFKEIADCVPLNLLTAMEESIDTFTQPALELASVTENTALNSCVYITLNDQNTLHNNTFLNIVPNQMVVNEFPSSVTPNNYIFISNDPVVSNPKISDDTQASVSEVIDNIINNSFQSQIHSNYDYGNVTDSFESELNLCTIEQPLVERPLPKLIPIKKSYLKSTQPANKNSDGKNINLKPTNTSEGGKIKLHKGAPLRKIFGIKEVKELCCTQENGKIIKIRMADTIPFSKLREAAEKKDSGVMLRFMPINGKIDKNYPNNCDKCSASFKKLSDFQRHYRVHTKERPYICDVCNASFSFKSALKTHIHNPKIHTKLNTKKAEKNCFEAPKDSLLGWSGFKN